MYTSERNTLNNKRGIALCPLQLLHLACDERLQTNPGANAHREIGLKEAISVRCSYGNAKDTPERAPESITETLPETTE